MPKKRIYIHAKPDFWIDVQELQQYNGIFWALWYREAKVRYFQSILGWIWAIFQPLVSVLVLYLVFGLGLQTPTKEVFYPIWVSIGMICWLYTVQTCQQCANVMLQSRHFTEKIYFPHIWLPLSKIGITSIDFLVQMAIWLLIYICFFAKISLYLLFFPLILVWFWLFVGGLGIGLAGFCNRYRDAMPLVQMLLQIGFFVSPVAYSVDIIPQKWHFLYYLNPLVGMLDMLRACFFGNFLWKYEFLGSFLVSIFVFFGGIIYFQKKT